MGGGYFELVPCTFEHNSASPCAGRSFMIESIKFKILDRLINFDQLRGTILLRKTFEYGKRMEHLNGDI